MNEDDSLHSLDCEGNLLELEQVLDRFCNEAAFSVEKDKGDDPDQGGQDEGGQGDGIHDLPAGKVKPVYKKGEEGPQSPAGDDADNRDVEAVPEGLEVWVYLPSREEEVLIVCGASLKALKQCSQGGIDDIGNENPENRNEGQIGEAAPDSAIHCRRPPGGGSGRHRLFSSRAASEIPSPGWGTPRR